MPGSGSLRGNINAILNPMVREGYIKGFSTNLYGARPPEQVIVRVIARAESETGSIRRRVLEALEPFSENITVMVDLPDGSTEQEQE